MRFVFDSFVVRLLAAWGRLGVLCVCVEGMCVIILNTYNHYMHTTNWRYLQALWVLQDTIRTRTKGT